MIQQACEGSGQTFKKKIKRVYLAIVLRVKENSY